MVSWFVVVVVVTATTAGFFHRFLTPDDAPYLLVTREVADHPFLALLIFVATLAGYAAIFRRLCRLLDAWREGAPAPSAPQGFAVRVKVFVEYVFARWYRIALVLFVVWLPFYVTSFPGQPSPDAANMFTEFLQTRADFANTPLGAGPDLTAPYVDYPTSTYLLTDSDSLWSNHHPLYLMLGYGGVGSVSIHLFDSLVPAVVFISVLSALVTLVAFGRALTILGRLVPSWRVRGIALAVVAATPLIALWSMATHKNQLFAAAFVWWLALVAEFLHRPVTLRRRWYVETAAVSLLMAVSVPFGWIIVVGQAVAMLFVKRRRFTPLLVMGLPALLVFGTISLASATGVLIPSDPIETKGLQLQELALILNEHPDALTTDERAELSRIFDIGAVVAGFNPSISDPVKSTGPLETKTKSFKYQTVQPEDWDSFNALVVKAGLRHPDTFVDGLFLKSYRYLDPFDEGTDWYPPWSPTYDRVVDGHRVAPVELNRPARKMVREKAYDCYRSPACRPTMSHGVKTVAVVLLCAAGIAVGRRFAWLWALPFALQLAIAGVSPLSAGGRYVLGFTYGLGIVVLLLAIDDRSSPSPGRTPTDSPGSSRPSRLPSRRPSQRV